MHMLKQTERHSLNSRKDSVSNLPSELGTPEVRVYLDAPAPSKTTGEQHWEWKLIRRTAFILNLTDWTGNDPRPFQMRFVFLSSSDIASHPCFLLFIIFRSFWSVVYHRQISNCELKHISNCELKA